MIEVLGCAVSIYDDCGELTVGIHKAGTSCREVLMRHEPGDCEMAEYLASYGIDPAVMQQGPEDNVSGLIVAWYAHHLAHGGARDPVQDDLLREVLAEDALGGGISHQPGRA